MDACPAFGSSAKMCFISSPTIAGSSNIETAFLASDQRRFKISCPRCSAWSPLEWKHITFETKSPAIPPTWQCPCCRAQVPEDEVRDATADGVWIPTFPGRETVGLPSQRDVLRLGPVETISFGMGRRPIRQR